MAGRCSFCINPVNPVEWHLQHCRKNTTFLPNLQARAAGPQLGQKVVKNCFYLENQLLLQPFYNAYWPLVRHKAGFDFIIDPVFSFYTQIRYLPSC
jgi:hypothetical protein